jgi:hypothetical protein
MACGEVMNCAFRHSGRVKRMVSAERSSPRPWHGAFMVAERLEATSERCGWSEEDVRKARKKGRSGSGSELHTRTSLASSGFTTSSYLITALNWSIFGAF